MKNWLKNWRTTLAGTGALFMLATAVSNNPALLADPKTVATAIAAVGLILAKDSEEDKVREIPAPMPVPEPTPKSKTEVRQ